MTAPIDVRHLPQVSDEEAQKHVKHSADALNDLVNNAHPDSWTGDTPDKPTSLTKADSSQVQEEKHKSKHPWL